MNYSWRTSKKVFTTHDIFLLLFVLPNSILYTSKEMRLKVLSILERYLRQCRSAESMCTGELRVWVVEYCNDLQNQISKIRNGEMTESEAVRLAEVRTGIIFPK